MLKSYDEKETQALLELEQFMSDIYEIKWLNDHIIAQIKKLPENPEKEQIMHINGLLTLYVGTAVYKLPPEARDNYLEFMIGAIKASNRKEFAGWIEFLRERQGE